jgi:hypothetical protein
VGQELAHEEGVVGTKPPRHGLTQGGELGPQLPEGQLGQNVGVRRAADQRLLHRPAGHAEHIGGDGGKLDSRVLQQFVEPIGPRVRS